MCEYKTEDTKSQEIGDQPSNLEGNAKQSRESVPFDEALTETKYGKFNYLIIFISGLVLTAVLLETLGISFVLPVSQCDMNLSTENKGVLSAVGFAGIIASSHLWGFLADTKGRRKIILPTLLIAFSCTVLSSLTANFWIFAILRFLNGFFVSGSSATIYPYLGEFHNNKNRSRALMGASFIFGVGCMLLPALAWLVINHEWSLYIPLIDIVYRPWRLFLIVCGLPGLTSALLLLYIPESPKFLLAEDKQAETIAVLKFIYHFNTGKPKESYQIESVIDNEIVHAKEAKAKLGVLKSMWNQTAPLFKPPHLRMTMLACFINFGMFATSNGMYMFFPDILNRIVDLTNDHPNYRATICQIVYDSKLSNANVVAQNYTTVECVTQLEMKTFEHSFVLEIFYAGGFALIGLIINKVGKLPILVVVYLGCGLAGIASIYVDIPIVAIYSYVVLLLCGLGVTVMNAATVDLYPTKLRAMAVCIALMMGRLGSVVGSNIVGLLLDNHCELTFGLSGSSLILCGFLCFLIPNIRHKKEEMKKENVENA